MKTLIAILTLLTCSFASAAFDIIPVDQPAQSGPVLYDFSAKWCGPCQQMVPVVQQMNADGCAIQTVDIDSNPSLAAQYGVTSIPCFVAVQDGKEVGRITGKTGSGPLRNLWNRLRHKKPAPTVSVNTPMASVQVGGPMANVPVYYDWSPMVAAGYCTCAPGQCASGQCSAGCSCGGSCSSGQCAAGCSCGQSGSYFHPFGGFFRVR